MFYHRLLASAGGSLRSAVLAVVCTSALMVAATADPALIDEIVSAHSTADLPEIRKRKQLRALVTYSRTDFAIQSNGQPSGLQVALLSEYEKVLNKGVKHAADRTQIVFVPTTFDRLLPDLEQGRGDVAAALLTITPERKKQFDFATGAAMVVDEVLVIHKDTTGIQSLEDLSGREVLVLRNSSYVEHLRTLNKRLAVDKRKPIKVREADSQLLSEDILEMVNAGVVGITIVDDYKAKLWAKVLSDIRVLESVPLSTGNSVGWAVRKSNPLLHRNLLQFAAKAKKGTLLGNMLFDRYYEDARRITNPLADSERSKFQKVVGLFARFAEQYEFDVLAIAAQAYQESRLDHSKRSKRGAYGIMQMLPSTAADPNVGIPEITSLENNIHAGVKYLAFLRDRYFSEPGLEPSDRLAFSLAAYNAGPAKVASMRSMAGEMGLDPDVWFGNVELAAGKTVGDETVNYVRNIFKYYLAYSLVEDQLITRPLAVDASGRRAAG